LGEDEVGKSQVIASSPHLISPNFHAIGREIFIPVSEETGMKIDSSGFSRRHLIKFARAEIAKGTVVSYAETVNAVGKC